MTIRKRLIQITILVVLFAIMEVFGLLQVVKGARFHQLNFLHLKHVIELNSVLPHQIDDTYEVDVEVLRPKVLDIQAQPLKCLEIINAIDRIVMRLIKTDHAIDLCVNDVEAADLVLLMLERYEKEEASANTVYHILIAAAAQFTNNSNEFEKPIAETVGFIVKSSILSSFILSAFMITSIIYASRSISNTVIKMNQTAKALEESERLNRQLAHYDSLTGLPNRYLLLDRLSYQLGLARRKRNNLSLLFIDLDHFKNVNDSMGHHAGDELIREAGKRLRSCVRDTDTVARIGGDEFNIILSEITNIESPVLVAEKILEQLSKPFEVVNQTVYISGSIGISIYPSDADNVDDLQKYADLAMYHAKSKGRNNFEFYSNDLDQRVNKRLSMEQRLRRALENDELLLHYQPVVRLSDLRIVGVEALVRWNQPELGMVSPIDFIPLAEETGLIVEIGRWVLKEACKNSKKWFDQCGKDFKIAVNVSSMQLRSATFIDIVQEALDEANLPPSVLDLEITESLMIEEEGISLETLNELSKLGVRLLLDDFGTGHSSLSYLHRLPFNILKVDRSFVFKLNDKSNAKNITSSIVAMAHELNLQVIAEGLETPEALKFLKDLKCEFAQGFLFSKPVPAEEIDCNKVYKEFL